MIINELPAIMIKCLLITIFSETLLAIILGIRKKKDILNVILVNILTNPIVVSVPVYINIAYGIKERNIVLCILEILTIIVEGTIYKKYLNYKKINGYLLALILNGLSYLLGLIINNIF